MYAHGVEPNLDFTDLPHIVKVYEKVTRMHVYERQPYAGKLVFAAFSGSHQELSQKVCCGVKHMTATNGLYHICQLIQKILEENTRQMLFVSTASLGKGGIGFLLEKTYGIRIPTKMREEVGYSVKDVSDHTHKELQPKEVLKVFNEKYVNICDPIELLEVHFKQEHGGISTEIILNKYGVHKVYHGKGNGRLDARK